jgi:hypothetical protein
MKHVSPSMKHIAVLETKVSGLEDRLSNLKGSILLIESKLDARFTEMSQKLDSLFTRGYRN